MESPAFLRIWRSTGPAGSLDLKLRAREHGVRTYKGIESTKVSDEWGRLRGEDMESRSQLRQKGEDLWTICEEKIGGSGGSGSSGGGKMKPNNQWGMRSDLVGWREDMVVVSGEPMERRQKLVYAPEEQRRRKQGLREASWESARKTRRRAFWNGNVA